MLELIIIIIALILFTKKNETGENKSASTISVSYTHLTLPTNSLV